VTWYSPAGTGRAIAAKRSGTFTVCRCATVGTLTSMSPATDVHARLEPPSTLRFYDKEPDPTDQAIRPSLPRRDPPVPKTGISRFCSDRRWLRCGSTPGASCGDPTRGDATQHRPYRCRPSHWARYGRAPPDGARATPSVRATIAHGPEPRTAANRRRPASSWNFTNDTRRHLVYLVTGPCRVSPPLEVVHDEEEE
jgi:hypothetical protein